MGYAKIDLIPTSQDTLIHWASPCRVATTANITLSGAQTIDGIACVADDRVLVKNQTLPAENGVYVVASGAWSRAADSNSVAELNYSAVDVLVGTLSAGISFLQTSVIVTLGVDAVVYAVNGVFLSNTTPQAVGAAALAGTSALASRSDHVHVGSANAIVGPSSSVDGEIVLFDSTTGKLAKRATTSGVLKGTSGVLSAAVAGTDYALPFTLKAVVTGAGTTMASWDSQPVDPTGGAFAITTPASPANGDVIRIRNISSSVNTVTVTANSGQTIEGVATYAVGGAYFSVEFCYYTVGTKWTCIRQG
jgi:hypothetical protein